VSILILRVYVVDYCSVRGVLFFLGRHGKCILSHDSSRVNHERSAKKPSRTAFSAAGGEQFFYLHSNLSITPQ
jgi:hypothetical protein